VVAGHQMRSPYLVRHAFAAHADPALWPDDAERPLTPDGTSQFRVAARGLRELVPHVDCLLSSVYARAWETAELLHEVTGWPRPHACPALAPGWPPASAFDVLRERDERSIALVGHEPYLSGLASLLCAGHEKQLRLELKKGAVAFVRVERDIRPDAGYLIWTVTPKVLRALEGADGERGHRRRAPLGLRTP
jgi:phosphohistidine phosphatase